MDTQINFIVCYLEFGRRCNDRATCQKRMRLSSIASERSRIGSMRQMSTES